MKAIFKPLLEWIALIALALGLGFGLAWLPVERSIKEIGMLIVAGLVLAWVFYAAVVGYPNLWSDLNDWDDEETTNDLTSSRLEVKP